MKYTHHMMYWACLALIASGCGDNLPPLLDLPAPACESDESCDDGLFCNGTETCNPLEGCQAGTPPSVDDGISCTEDRCDEANDEIVHTAQNSACDDGLFCNGAETCSPTDGCVAGEAPVVDDGIDCTNDTCDEDTQSVIHTANNDSCDDGISCTVDRCSPATGCFSVPDDSVCGPREVCRPDDGGCVELVECTSPNDPRCDDGQACTVDSCNMDTGRCVNAPDDSLCDDGFECTTDRCDPVAGCFTITDDSACDDGISCTVDRCADGIGCFTVPDDGLCEENEICRSDAGGCQLPPACNGEDDERCDDGQDCTVDSCDVETGRCVHVPNDTMCNDDLFCNGVEVCLPFRGCVTSEIPNCDDGVFCTLDRCNEDTDTCEQQPANVLCDDGQFCNGAEVCDLANDCQPGAAPNIDDGVGCTDDSCDEENDVVVNTVNDGNCNDDQFCNGVETCDAVNDCQAGEAPNVDDGVGCTDDTCDEENDVIVNTVNNGNCDDGQFCNGAETCDAVNDCQAGVAPTIDDGVGCTDDSCDEENDVVVNAVNNGNCDDGQFCNGAETCDAVNDCQPGAAPTVDDGVGCTDDSCDEENDVVVNAINHGNCNDDVSCTNDVCDAVNDCSNTADNSNCDDGQFCNGAETCDAVNDCQPGEAPTIDDGVACTDDSCDEENDVVVNTVNNGNCDDGQFCNGAETCDAVNDCQAGEAPTIDDGVGCTDDSCDEENDVVVNAVNNGNCDDGQFCNGAETCDAVNDCQPGAAPSVDDGVGCTDDSCDEENDVVVNAVNNGNCDDGQFCNGAETCDAVNDCQPGAAPTVDDGVGCTDDSCDEENDVVVNAVNNSNCDDGLFCNGAETCDAVNDCQAGVAPTVDDGVGCTDDSCDEENDVVVNAVNNGNCDDGLFCNGAETCDAVNDCQPAADACVGGDVCNAVTCNEEADACENVPLCFNETVDEVDFEAGRGGGSGLAFDGEQGGLVVSTGSTIDEDSLWVVNTAESSLSKWDAKTSTEVARYKVGLSSGECLNQCCWNSGCNMPSRTVVDGRGDVYVASRGFGMQGTVTKVAGTIDDCVDRNNNGTIDTSTSATAMAFDTDECVLWTAPVGESNALLRALAIDTGDADHPEGYPWVGGYNDFTFYKLNPSDGSVITTVDVSPLRPYGGVVLANDDLWIGTLGGAQTGYFNTAAQAPSLTLVDYPTDIPTRTCTSSYGITADADGRVWFGGWGCRDAVAYDTNAGQWGHVRGEGDLFAYTAGRGITPDSEGRIWMALDGSGNGTNSHIVWWNANDLVLGGTLDVPTANIIDMPAGNTGPSALGLDKAGYLWLAHYSAPSNLLRIDPDTEVVDSYTGPNQVYSYTDFTGGVFRTVVANGFYDEDWDGTCDSPEWGELEWEATTPEDTFITFNVRTADTEAGLNDATPVLLGVLPPDESPGNIGDALIAAGETPGRFLRLTSFLQGGAGITPVLHNYTVTWTCPAP